MENGEGEKGSFMVEGPDEQIPVPMRKRKIRPKKKEFIGWASKSLTEFLQSIGKDTNTKLSQYDVTGIINDYVHKLNLLHAEKRKKIVCDERLRSLFGKKSVSRNKIYDLLESHFAENHDSSEDDLLYTSEEYEEDGNLTFKRQKVSSSENKATYKKKEVESPKSCFAAIIPENIKLVYLKKTLIEYLLRNPESFEGKLMGSYIRIKCDPNDLFQKNSHQLHPVTGIKNLPEKGDVDKEILFQVPNAVKDIPVSLLSDADFSEEECEDLHQRIKDGLLKRPTVVELEEKAHLLHEDITKHWLPRELKYLQNLIDRANEKGWRKELFEFMQRKQLLEKPAEQSRLLLELPKVVADELEPEPTLPEQNPEQDRKSLDGSSPAAILSHASNISYITIDSRSGANQGLSSELPLDAAEDKPVNLIVEKGGNMKPLQNERNEGLRFSYVGQATSVQEVEAKPSELATAYKETSKDKVEQVIELSDDDADGEDQVEEKKEDHDVNRPKWLYFDPKGRVQGPFSTIQLSMWNNMGYFPPNFKIWEESPGAKAILLTDMLSAWRKSLPS